VKLTLDKCKEICRDFRLAANPGPDGKRRCLQIISDDMCKLPSHFVCELARFRDRSERNEKLKVDAVSASRVGTIEQCLRAYNFHYEHKLDPEGSPPWKRMGDAFGVARARLDVGLDVDVEAGLRPDLLPYEAAKVRAAIRLYRHKWVGNFVGYHPGEVTCEEEVLFERHGLWWLGYIDAISKDRQKIWEWKFAVSEYDVLSIARQAAIYLAGVEEAKEFTCAVFRKPGQRPRKDEPPAEYENRVANEMTKHPEEWLKKFVFTRDHLNVAGVLRDTAESFSARLKAGDATGWGPSLSRCYECDYRSICASHIGMTTEALVQLRKKEPVR